jgi:hypothetical protein
VFITDLIRILVFCVHKFLILVSGKIILGILFTTEGLQL